MRVIHLVQDRGIRPGSRKGAAVHVSAMCDAFRRVGADVVRVHGSEPAEARRCLNAALHQPVDLIYERYALGAFEGSRIAHMSATAHVIEVNAPLVDEAEMWRDGDGTALDQHQERQMFGRARAVLCVSPQVAEYVARRGARPDSVLIRANGVDTTLFHPSRSPSADRRRWFPQLKEPFVVGFHGRLRPWHGLARIVAACRLALAQERDVALLCVGEGDFEAQLRGELPDGNWRVEPWCAQPELAAWVAGFSVLPLAYDPNQDCYFSPLKLREAMAAGVVPIVPRLGDLDSIVKSGRTGVVYDARRSAALADAIVRLKRQPERHAKLALAARATVLCASWEQIARDVLECVEGASR